MFEAVLLELGRHRGAVLHERQRRADQRQRRHAIRMASGECARDRATDLCSDEMEAVDLQRVHEGDVVIDDALDRPRKIAWHRRGLAEAAHVRPHDLEPARKLGHPAIPRGAAFGITVEHQDRVRLRPGSVKSSTV